MTRAAAAWITLLSAGIACRQAVPQPPAPSPAPAKTPEFRTTSGLIAQRNLDAQIEGARQKLKYEPGCGACRLSLAGLYLSRAKYFGRLSDYDRALELADEAVRLHSDSTTLLGRAKVRAALHQFDLARADLAAAHSEAPEAAFLSVSIEDALGDVTRALAHLRKISGEDTTTLSEEALLVGETGATAGAAALFEKARAAYRDPSPFTPAYLDLQEGLMWEREGNLEKARERFDLAHRRLPGYVAAASHLAGVLPDIDQAIAVLEPFADVEDPEPAGQLAQLLVLGHRGADERAARLTERARHAYEDLTTRHPEAFADHAARFYLGAGSDPAKALEWARRNAQWRVTPASHQLWLDAALRAGATNDVCEVVTAVKAHGWADKALAAGVAAAERRCVTSPQRAAD